MNFRLHARPTISQNIIIIPLACGISELELLPLNSTRYEFQARRGIELILRLSLIHRDIPKLLSCMCFFFLQINPSIYSYFCIHFKFNNWAIIASEQRTNHFYRRNMSLQYRNRLIICRIKWDFYCTVILWKFWCYICLSPFDPKTGNQFSLTCATSRCDIQLKYWVEEKLN